MSLLGSKSTLISAAAAVVAIIIWVLVVERDERLINAKIETETQHHTISLGTSLELAIDKRLAVFAGFKAFVDHSLTDIGTDLNENMKAQMDEFARSQFQSNTGIRNFSLAPMGVQEWVFPFKGNEAVIGHNLIRDNRVDVREDVKRAIRTKNRTISGPYQLRQGGLGLIVRQGIYHKGKFWGLLAMVIDIPPLINLAGIERAQLSGKVGLRRQDGKLFWGDVEAFSNPAMIAKINLPEGYWELGNIRNEGLNVVVSSETQLFKISFGAFLAMVVAFIFFFLRRQAVLENEVIRKTSDVQRSETRFKNFAESASDWFWESDEHTNITYCSERYFEITGFDPSKLGGFDYKTLLYSKNRERDEENWKDLYKKVERREAFRHFEYETIRANKEIIHISVSGTPIYDEQGLFCGYRGAGLDITERKLTEEENRTYAELFNKWKTSNFIGIVQCRSSGEIIDVNDTLLSMIGYTRDEFEKEGLDWRVLTPSEYRSLDKKGIQDASNKGYFTAFEKEYFHKDGHRVPILIGGTRYREQPDEYIEFVLNITEQKKTQTILAQATERAEAASLAKSEFLAAMSHEIRTPMAGVVGMAELLIESELTSEQLDWALNVKGSAVTLLKILTEILDQSKLEAGKLEIAPIDFHLETFVNEITSLFGPNILSKGLILTVVLDDKLPDTINADHMRIGQILSNLLSNALKFTEKGEISVKVTLQEETPEFVRLNFTVEDSGIGLTKEGRERLFSAFSQADSSTSRNYGGTGLGLSISQKLAHLMGGDIGVKTAKGQGSAFWFEIKCQKAKEKIKSAPKRVRREQWKASRSLKILLAEDNLINQQLIQAIFYKLGHDIKVADDGEEAVEYVEKNDFDIILMDVRMPVMDGLEATTAIRNMKNGKANVPIIAVTADIAAGNIKKYTDAGMNDVCSKPIEMSVLLQSIDKQLNENIHSPITDKDRKAAKPDTSSNDIFVKPKDRKRQIGVTTTNMGSQHSLVPKENNVVPASEEPLDEKR